MMTMTTMMKKMILLAPPSLVRLVVVWLLLLILQGSVRSSIDVAAVVDPDEASKAVSTAATTGIVGTQLRSLHWHRRTNVRCHSLMTGEKEKID